ncbi:putative sulfite oxidase-like isoform X1 [Capsicum annuum]|uniref:AAA ATPase AAA+ lid domain-containing protein n=1 Tax=Capsicum annuum TaxID=4072 RepID=A0A2G2YWZ4_CAPAN|nr:putative sulfite oxidase-like isoform X1 [Capsicum annuum]KAF3625406.1 putative sulfite oxidase-like isoform X1 [Capsicum annuum]PHT74272.1 hypothetical protein T459_21549 [Capsicum annuum]
MPDLVSRLLVGQSLKRDLLDLLRFADFGGEGPTTSLLGTYRGNGSLFWAPTKSIDVPHVPIGQFEGPHAPWTFQGDQLNRYAKMDSRTLKPPAHTSPRDFSMIRNKNFASNSSPEVLPIKRFHSKHSYPKHQAVEIKDEEEERTHVNGSKIRRLHRESSALEMKTFHPPCALKKLMQMLLQMDLSWLEKNCTLMNKGCEVRFYGIPRYGIREARAWIIKILLEKDGLFKLLDKDIVSIRKFTYGYSGSDMKNLVKDASMGPLRETLRHDIEITKLKKKDMRPVTLQDFESALQEVSPSVSFNELGAYED